MSKDNLLKIEEISCPICNEVHNIEIRERLSQAIVNNEIVSYEEIYYLCTRTSDEEENEFVPAKVLDENLLRAKEAYRIKECKI